MCLCNRWKEVGGYRHWLAHTPITGNGTRVSRANQTVSIGPLPDRPSPLRGYPQPAVEDSIREHALWAMDPVADPSITGNRRRPLPVIGETRATRLWSAPMGL